ncbi:N-acyl amino acid synthase FeeM domain-containing protein [Rhizobium sp.]|uniref:N-acyl amino acid synthase FeeM domain-containing protein n=1 Tax=Rhizobium sp. TaxID=391 RepID=UPI000DB9DACC
MVDNSLKTSDFSSKILEIMDHVEYRRIESGEDMEEVERLRYKAYKAREVLPVAAKSMIDDADFDSQAYVFGLYYYEQLVSTIRIHHVTPDHRVSQSGGIFPAEMNAFLDAGLSLVDPARFAADPELSTELPWLPYLTLRPNIVAAAHFRADRVMQHVRPAHAAFYKRVFYADTVVANRMTETYGFELTLMATNVIEVGRKLLTRYPFFISSASEQRMMFSRDPVGGMPPLNIIPTARFMPEGDLGTDLPL